MKAGKEKAEFLADEVTVDGIVHHGNFIIRDDGKLVSGGGINLNGRNGDIHITDDIQAAKGITASITEMGSVYFDRNVTVTNDVNITTDEGDIEVGHTVTSNDGTVSLKSGSGDISVGKDITAGKDVSISSNEGNIVVGTILGDEGSVLDGDVLSKTGNVSIQTGEGSVMIVKTVTALGQQGSIDNTSGKQQGSINIESGKGDILIGNNGASVKTVSAEQNVKLAAQDGVIKVYGKTETKKGDITVVARDKDNNNNLIIDGINFNGELYAGTEKEEKPDEVTGNLTLQTYNGDIEITDYTKAAGNINAKVENKGDITFGRDVETMGDLNFEVDDGDIIVGQDVKAAGNISMTAGTGSIIVGADTDAEKGTVTSTNGNVGIKTNEGLVAINKAVAAQEGNIDVQVGTGGVLIGNNGKDVETVTAKHNIDIGVELGQIKIFGKTSTEVGDISMAAGSKQYTPGERNFIIEQNGLLESGRDINLTGRNGDLHVTDAIQATRNLNTLVTEGGGVYFDRDADINGDITIAVQNGDVQMHNMNATGNTTIISTGSGSINGNNIVSGGTTHVALTNGDLFLNLAEGKAVVLRMENNTAASRVNTVLADASGGAGTDVELTGNYIPIGTIAAKGGNSVLQLSAMGAGNQKLISGEISVGSLRSANGTHMPSLWANRGNIRVDEGNLGMDDVLAVDKIHLENSLTDLAVYGRTPTRDGEQLAYWNNLGRAYSKTRPFDLYTDGKVRTHRAVLVDAGRYYDKLYGDNLSVVDMKREWLTFLHGQFAFDSTQLTKPGETLRDKVIFGMEAVDADIRRHNASADQLL